MTYHTLTVELPATDAQGFMNFLQGYVEAMLWSTSCEIGVLRLQLLQVPDRSFRDEGYDIGNLAPEAYAQAFADCLSFWLDNRPWITEGNLGKFSQSIKECTVDEYAGHDFWLTRCGHGCGFWDGEWIGYAGERLDTAAKAFGNQDPYLGDDGKIYL